MIPPHRLIRSFVPGFFLCSSLLLFSGITPISAQDFSTLTHPPTEDTNPLTPFSFRFLFLFYVPEPFNPRADVPSRINELVKAVDRP